MYEFDKLCFEGCGIFGIVYVGAIKYLEEQDLIKQVSHFSGTSSGAIISTMLNLGYKSNEIYSILKAIDWNKFYDYNIGFLNFFSGYGLYKGNKLHDLYKNIIKNKTNSPNTTFKELYEKTGKKLYMCAINVDKEESVYFSVDTHPFMEIHLALRLSTSFPFVFKSLKYNQEYYVDGGVMDNYPMEVFNDCSKALGFNLVTSSNKKSKIDGIICFTKSVISAMTKSQHNLELHPYKKQTICIYNDVDSLLTSVMDIGDMKDDFDNYYKLGYDTTKKAFNSSGPSQIQESPQEDH